MNRKGLLTCLALTGLMANITGYAHAADPLADELLSRWRTELQSMARVSITLRLRRFNDTFKTEEDGPAVYFREDQHRWAICIGWEPEALVSALRPLNPAQTPTPIEPQTIISTADEVIVSDGVQYENHRWAPVSACEPENVPSWANIFGDLGEDILSALADDASLPLFLPESPEILSFEIHSATRPNGDRWLTLRPAGHKKWQRRFQQVDAVFHDHESLPYAIRVIDPSGSGRTHFLFHDIRSGDNAVIPDDAFEPQGRLLTFPRRTTP